MGTLEKIYWTRMYREVASHFEGDVGIALFDYYAAINRVFFNETLPPAFLLTGITPYGACIGLTKPAATKQPIILIHPSLDTPEKQFYTVLHEAIHANVMYNLRQGKPNDSRSSHSNPEWLAEINRIAAMLGYSDITIGFPKPTRVKYDTPDGTRKSSVQRVNTGSVGYECSYTFPHALEKETGQPLPHIEQWLSK